MKKTIFALLVASSLFASGETFQTTDDFSLTLPDDWIEVPKEVLDDVSKNLAKLSPDTPKQIYDYGYQLAEAERWLKYPYILVQVKNIGRVASGELSRYKKIEKEFNEELEQVEEGFSEIMSNATLGETIYDENNHMLWTTITMDVEGAGKVNCMTALKLTEKGYIQLNAYATEDTFSDLASIYRTAFVNLKVNDSIAYKPQITDSMPILGGINSGKVLAAGIKGAIIGGVVGFIALFNKKNKKKNS